MLNSLMSLLYLLLINITKLFVRYLFHAMTYSFHAICRVQFAFFLNLNQGAVIKCTVRGSNFTTFWSFEASDKTGEPASNNSVHGNKAG